MDIWLIQLLAGVAVAFVGAALGYLFQARKLRARPFIHLRGFGGRTLDGDANVHVDEQLVKKSKGKIYLHELSPTMTLGALGAAREKLLEIEHFGAASIQNIDESIELIGKSQSSLDVLRGLVPALSLYFVEDFIVRAVIGEKLAKPEPDIDSRALVAPYFHSGTRDGCFAVNLPGSSLFLGSGLNNPAIKALYEPFVELYCTGDESKIVPLLIKVRKLLEKELEDSKELKGPVEEVSNEHCAFSAQLLLANYGQAGIVIMDDAEIEIKEEGSKVSRTLPAKLYAYERGNGVNAYAIHKQLGGRMLEMGKSVECMVYSSQKQKELTHGVHVRSMFDSESALARIHFTVVSPGIPSTKKLKSAWKRFKERSPE